MGEITREDIELPNYRNSNPVGSLAGEDMLLGDVAVAKILAGLNGHYRGKKSTGKTQLMRDIYNGFFHGNKWALWEEGRSDFKPKELFESLNISLAKGSIENMPECRAVYSADDGVEYLIRSYKENGDSDGGELQLTWKKISKEEKERIEADFSITTADLQVLRNVDKRFFCIDEYNRCPEVVMNLFYGLMTGEINHDGTIIKLGNGYYSGIAASNPDDYEGTFKMDPAMWARYHIVLDFDAYEITVRDRDELKTKNLSPGVQEARLKDLTDEVEEIFKGIGSKKPTLKERVVLQYLQSGLNYCSNPDISSHSKEQINWPRACGECDKSTRLCGVLRGIDERAVRAVYRLAKGLEEVVRIKKGHKRNHDVKINPVDSLVLAYQFVAPYKGIVSPKAGKEKLNIEALVLREFVKTIRDNLNDKFKQLEDLAAGERVPDKTQRNLNLLRREFNERNRQKEYANLENEVRKQFEVVKTLDQDEIFEQFTDELEEKEKEVLAELMGENMEKYQDQLMEKMKSIDANAHEQLQNLIKASEWTEEEYGKDVSSTGKPYQQFVTETSTAVMNVLAQFNDKHFVKDPAFREKVYAADPELREKIKQLSRQRILEEKKPDEEITYLPEDRKPHVNNELRRRLVERLQELKKQEFDKKKKGLFAEEWFFLREFYDEFVAAKNGK